MRDTAESQSLGARQSVSVASTSFGWMAMQVIDDRIHSLTFGHDDPELALSEIGVESSEVVKPCQRHCEWLERIVNYCDGQVDQLRDLPLELSTYTPFQKRVIEACREIPFGSTASYGELAARAGSPKAARAVGTVMRQNRLPLIVPCHRVVGSTGLGGYSASNGVTTKQLLLAMERDSIRANQDGQDSKAETAQ